MTAKKKSKPASGMRTFEVWLDSGANNASRRTVTVTLEELGYSSAEWDRLSDKSKEREMREIAFACSDWGFREIAGMG